MLTIIPNRYPDRPWRWLENQMAHTMAGQASAFGVCLVWLWVAGEFPHRMSVFIALSLIYLLWIELIKQGWQGVDTIEDTGFFSVGAGFVLYAFREVALGTGRFEGVIWDLMPLVVGWAVYLIGGMIGRELNKRAQRQ